MIPPDAPQAAPAAPRILQDWWAWCNAHPHALDTVAKRPAAVIDALWAQLSALQAAAPPEGELSEHLKYARGLLQKAARSGASFMDINVSTVAYLCENRRHLNDRIRWLERDLKEARELYEANHG